MALLFNVKAGFSSRKTGLIILSIVFLLIYDTRWFRTSHCAIFQPNLVYWFFGEWAVGVPPFLNFIFIAYFYIWSVSIIVSNGRSVSQIANRLTSILEKEVFTWHITGFHIVMVYGFSVVLLHFENFRYRHREF